MKNLRSMALILGVTLMPFGANFALAKSEGTVAKEAPAAVGSGGKASSGQRPRGSAEHIIKQIANTTFPRLDTDKDGKVGHDEFMAPYEKQFKETDSNGDGFWTKEEYVDFRMKQMTKKRKRPKKQ